ncbi:unnamed protein product [Enterobius vermicularis]|uniref:Uncharacterized protein n=1 Tax=Enterobius vermicularis TaxID=51028 RepID=A0A0N4VQR6_ENTVE|nr:unnamed protein product [Enterobius vermicularis]
MSQKPNSANSANSSNNTNAVCKPPADAVAAGCIAAAIRRHRRKKHRDSASFEHLVEREKRKRRTTFARFLETFVRKVFDTQEKIGISLNMLFYPKLIIFIHLKVEMP